MNRKLKLVLNPKNRYRNALYFGDLRILDGNSGLEAVKVEFNGAKKMKVDLTLVGDLQLYVVEDECPESYRYAQILRAVGDAEKVAAIHTHCEMLQSSPFACEGCPNQPFKRTTNQPIQAGRAVGAEAEENDNVGGKT